MIVDVVKGDLIKLALDGKYNAIVHGCNCFCKMGSGIALQIKTIFPQAYEADCRTLNGEIKKLGTYTKVDIPYEYNNREDVLTIINAYTQYNYGTDKMNVDYDAIEKVFVLINKDYANMNIGIPMIGAGLAGGDWDKISGIINEVTPDLDVHLVEFSK